MLNIAVSYSAFGFNESLNALDPLCGKGTALFESLRLGYNAYGIEAESKPVSEAFAFFKKYLETARYKHGSHTEKVGGQDSGGKKFTAVRYQVELAKNKDDKKDGRVLKWEIVAGDTRHCGTYFKKNSFHIITADLPYGVQHGSKDAKNISRSALPLVKEALPEWLKLLKPGGTVVLAWNLFLIPRKELTALFESHGLELPPDTDGFKHRVDQAIERDLIVGRKL